jgi:hypothetical protein
MGLCPRGRRLGSCIDTYIYILYVYIYICMTIADYRGPAVMAGCSHSSPLESLKAWDHGGVGPRRFLPQPCGAAILEVGHPRSVIYRPPRGRDPSRGESGAGGLAAMPGPMPGPAAGEPSGGTDGGAGASGGSSGQAGAGGEGVVQFDGRRGRRLPPAQQQRFFFWLQVRWQRRRRRYVSAQYDALRHGSQSPDVARSPNAHYVRRAAVVALRRRCAGGLAARNRRGPRQQRGLQRRKRGPRSRPISAWTGRRSGWRCRCLPRRGPAARRAGRRGTGRPAPGDEADKAEADNELNDEVNGPMRSMSSMMRQTSSR